MNSEEAKRLILERKMMMKMTMMMIFYMGVELGLTYRRTHAEDIRKCSADEDIWA